MSIPETRAEQLEAEIRRRISLHLENIRDRAPDGPALGLEDYRSLEQGFAWQILHEPGWEDVQSLWKDQGSYEDLEETSDPLLAGVSAPMSLNVTCDAAPVPLRPRESRRASAGHPADVEPGRTPGALWTRRVT